MSSHAAARSLIAALVLAAGSVVAPAATLTWDANGTTAGVTDGAGAWFTANRWWDGSSTTTWTSGNDAVFGVGGTGGAVTLSATTSVASLTFNTFAGTYTLGTTGTTLTVDAGGLTMNSGSGTVSIISPVALGAAQSWTNNKATTLTVSGIVGNGGNTLTVSGSGPSTLSGAISGAGGLTKSGDGLLILSAANTYTGLTTVSGGVLRLSSATALPGGINATGGVSALTLNGGVLELGQGNFLRNLGSGTGQFQITGGTSGFSAFGAGRAVTVNNNAAAAVTWGSAEFNPATFVLNESTANSPITFSNPINLNGATRTVAVNANTATLSGVLSGADAGLTKVGVGMLALSGNNTYAGSTQINAGTLQFVTPASLYGGVTANWTAANVVTGSGATLAVRVGASNFTAGNVTTLLTNLGGLGGSVADNGLKAGSSIGFDTSSAGGSFTVADSIADSTGTGGGAIGLVKLGSGTLTLPGSNAYTGPTQINAGVLTAGNASALGSGTIRFGGGTYQYTAATAGQDWSGRFKGSTSSISLDTNAQNVTLAGGIDSTNVGGLTKLGTGTLTLSGSNTYSGATTVSAGELHLLNGSFNNVSSLVPSAGATVRLTNAIVTNTTASSVFINGTFIQESGTYTADSGSADTYVAGLYRMEGGYLRLASGPYVSGTFNQTGGTVDMTRSSVILQMGGVAGITAEYAISGGTLNATTVNGSLRIGNGAAGTGRMTIQSAAVVNALTINFGSGATAAGVGILNLEGGVLRVNTVTNSGTGAAHQFNFSGGTLSPYSANSTIGSLTAINNTTVTLSGTTATMSSNDKDGIGRTVTVYSNLTGAGALTFIGTGTHTLSGSNTYAGSTQINAGTLQIVKPASLYGGTTANWTAANIVTGSGATLTVSVGASNFTADNVTTLLTNLGGLGGSVANNGLKAGSSIGFDTSTAGGSFTVADLIADSTGDGGGAIGLVKLGSGTLTLSAANTYSGATTISAGSVVLGNASALGAESGDVMVSSAVLDLGGYSVTRTGTVSVVGSTLQNGTITNNNGAFDVRSGTASATLAGSAGLTKTTSGTLRLSGANTYSGATTISGGSLVLANASALGAGSGNLAVSGGVLDLGALSFTRTGTVSFTGGTVQSGTIVNNTVAFDGQSGTVADTVTLSGSAGLIKTTSGTLIVGLNRTYTGETIVNAGKLQFRSTAGDYASPLTINNGGTLELVTIHNTSSMFIGDVTVNAGGTLATTNPPTGSGKNFVTTLILNGGTVEGPQPIFQNGMSIRAKGGVTSTMSAPIGNSSNGNIYNIYVEPSSTLVFSGQVQTGGSLVQLKKYNTGTLILSNTNNTYTGLTTVLAGVLNIRSNNALGTTLVGTTVTTDAALEVQGDITVGAEALTLNGAGITSGGALRNISGDNTYGGAITLGSVARINSDAGTLTLDVASGNAVAGAHHLTFGGAGNITVADAIATGTGGLTKDGAGTLTLSASNAYQGGTTINFGTLRAEHANAFGAGAIVLASNASLDLNNLAVANAITNNGGAISGLAGYAGTQNVLGLTALTGTVGGTVNVGIGGTLKGTNTGFTGAVTIANGGIHSPGNSPGVQTFENGISYDAGSTLIWELVANTTSNPGTAFDLVNVTGGNLAIADGALLQLEFQNTGLVSSAVDWSNTFWDVAQSWTIIDFSGGGNSSGNFTLLGSGTSWLDSTGASLATARNGASFQVSKFNNDVVLSYVIVVPEPGTLALAGIGVAVAGALFVRRRRG